MIDRLVDILGQSVPGLAPEEIADILWLALQIKSSQTGLPAQQSVRGSHANDGSLSDGESTATTQADEIEQSVLEAPPSSTSADTGMDLYADTGASIGWPGRAEDFLAFRTPEAPALPGQLDIARSLRPLMRRVASRVETVFDEAATVQQIADSDLWLPVLRPAPERWFDVAIVVDSSSSMPIWHQTIDELRHLLERHGAFRDVRIWTLSTDDKHGIAIVPGLNHVTANTRRRTFKELLSSVGRRLILVISDCVSHMWRDGDINPILATWGRGSLVTIVQVLPEHLWSRTALGYAPMLLLGSHIPAPLNAQLIFDMPRLRLGRKPLDGLHVPIVTLESEGISTWAKLIAGVSGARVPGAVFDATSRKRPVSKDNAPIRSSQERVDLFLNTASQEATSLAGLLTAAAPLNGHIMRLVQQAMLPDSRQVHLAEVVLSGVLRRVESDNEFTHPDEETYEFMEGVREILRRAVPTASAMQVLHVVSDYISHRIGRPFDFRAWLRNPTSTDLEVFDDHRRPFARVAASVLHGLGGQYAEIAQQLVSYTTPITPSLTSQVETLPSRDMPNLEDQDGGQFVVDKLPVTEQISSPIIESDFTETGKRLGIVIGVNASSSANLPSLSYAEMDAQQLAAALQQPACMFESGTTTLLGSAARTSAIRQTILRTTRQLTDKDLLLFYFSGHAVSIRLADGSSDIYLVTHDFDPDEVEQDTSMHLSLRWLWEHLYRNPAAGSVFIILDCSYSGNIASIAPSPLQIELKTLIERNHSNSNTPSQSINSRLVLTATGANQAAYQRDSHGGLSGLILAALRGETEEAQNDQGHVTIQGLYIYLSSQLPDQRPQLMGSSTRPIILADYSGSPEERSQNQRGIDRESRLQALLHDHSSFIADRLTSFVGRESELTEIRQHISELLPTGGYLIITGEPGQGKSSVIAKLVEEYGSRNVAHHFMPFNPGPDHQVALLRNLMARLILKHDLPDIYVASDSRPVLRDYFSNVLSEISNKGRQEVIFIDGLDQFEKDSDGVLDLSFLPSSPPSGIVFVLGTRPYGVLSTLQLLKPLYEYRLPPMSRAEFELMRGVRAEKLSIFLASPSDVRQERALAQKVIDEVNDTVALVEGVVLYLYSSEHAIPRYGTDGQAIINEQIGDLQKHDLFVGIMWNRIGTPTPRDISGTAEEFARAVNALKRRKKPQIWFYFRQAAASLKTQEDLDQRAGVLKFKSKLRGKGLFSEYTTPQSFQKKFREHLVTWLHSRRSQAPAKSGGISTEEATAIPASTSRRTNIVKNPGAWILLDDHFFQVASAIVQADRSIVVRIAPTVGEQIADLRALQGGDLHRRRDVTYADRHEAGTTQVQSVVSETSQGKTSFTVTLAPLPQRSNNSALSEFSFNAYSADAIAELRARLILLGQPLPKELEYLASSSQMRSSYSTPMASSIRTLPQLWASLHTQSRLFLPPAWIYAAYLLKIGNIVENILTLELGPIKDKKMHVKFRGRRARVYANREPVDIEFEGDCVLES